MRSHPVAPIPDRPGTYILVLESTSRRRVAVGALGTLAIEPGFYAYVGSALGPGGLRARLARHRGRARSPHWHIDHLRRHTALREIWYATGHFRREHRWAAVLAQSEGVVTPFAGFGSSDCRCRSHLFRFSRRPRLAQFERQFGASVFERSTACALPTCADRPAPGAGASCAGGRPARA